MTAEQHLQLEEKVVAMLRMVYDPEIPVDVYSLGLVYKIDIDDDGNLVIDMTMTAPNCPMADFIVEDARMKLESIEGARMDQRYDERRG
jgi:metal-sulfur cluster biosynthetic enzyme